MLSKALVRNVCKQNLLRLCLTSIIRRESRAGSTPGSESTSQVSSVKETAGRGLIQELQLQERVGDLCAIKDVPDLGI